jgi:hypothetical protein
MHPVGQGIKGGGHRPGPLLEVSGAPWGGHQGTCVTRG